MSWRSKKLWSLVHKNRSKDEGWQRGNRGGCESSTAAVFSSNLLTDPHVSRSKAGLPYRQTRSHEELWRLSPNALQSGTSRTHSPEERRGTLGHASANGGRPRERSRLHLSWVLVHSDVDNPIVVTTLLQDGFMDRQVPVLPHLPEHKHVRSRRSDPGKAQSQRQTGLPGWASSSSKGM